MGDLDDLAHPQVGAERSGARRQHGDRKLPDVGRRVRLELPHVRPGQCLGRGMGKVRGHRGIERHEVAADHRAMAGAAWNLAFAAFAEPRALIAAKRRTAMVRVCVSSSSLAKLIHWPVCCNA
jgi:hypothetical protein